MESDELSIDGLCFEKFISQREILQKIEALAAELNAFYGFQPVQLVVLMEGARCLYEAMCPKLNFPHQMIPLNLKTYEGLHSTHAATIPQDFLSQWSSERPILIVEDIIDTGRTLWSLLQYLKVENCHNVQIVSLLVKPDSHVHPIDCRFKGFTVGPEFVIGFGMDYNEQGRQLASVYRLNKESRIIDEKLLKT